MAITRHVVRNLNGGWSVREAGASRATRVFSTQQDAVRFAKEISKKLGGDLFVHRSDGRIRERDSYRKDPFPANQKRR